MRAIASVTSPLSAALVMAVAGCDSGRAPRTAAAVRDSAGIQIVDNTGSAWPTGGEWTVADTPSVSIGGAAAGPKHEFARVVGAVRMKDGRIAVANVGTSEIRWFDSTGRFVNASGRQGSGPGEFQTLGGLWSGPGDSLLVADVRAQRLGVFDPAGGFARHFALGGRAGLTVQEGGRINFAMPQAWLADGSVIGLEMPIGLGQTREGRYRDTVSYLRFGPDGVARDTIGRFPGIEMEQVTLTFGGRSFPSPSPVPLGRQTVVAARGTAVFVATNQRWEIEEYGTDGSLVRLIRLATTPVALTEQDIATHRQEQLDLVEGLPELRAVPPEMKTQITDRMKTVKYPATYPFILAMLPGPDGTLWVQEVVRPGEARAQYAAFDSAGGFLGRVRMPARFQLAMIGASEVIGVWKDADDVEHVRAYPMRR
ncbi:MAG: 6-bladed beta-propeller [Gemmatimonadales bacterium]